MTKKDWGIYGDSKREQAQGKRYEKEQPKTVPGRPWREYYSKKELAYRRKKAKEKGFKEEVDIGEEIAPDKQWLYTSHKKRLQQNRDKASKQFNIKRDKGGKGFSMVIQKKIKGFEEEAGMGKQTNIDEAEGIKTVSTKGYSGSKVSKPEKRPGTKGFINFKGGKPAAEADHAVLAHHKAEAAKQGKVVQLRYRGPRSHEGRQTYNIGASQTRGHATGAAIYYKDKSELGGRQREAARKARNEEYDMNEDEYPEANFDEIENEKGGEQEVMEPNVSDLVLNAIEQKPLDFQQSFADLMQQRIEDAVAERKLEVAAAFTGDDERSQYEAGEDEPEEEEETEVEEEPEAEEEGTEEEQDEVTS